MKNDILLNSVRAYEATTWLDYDDVGAHRPFRQSLVVVEPSDRRRVDDPVHPSFLSGP